MLNRLKSRFGGRSVEEGTEKSRRGFGARIAGVFARSRIGEEDWEELEDLLITGDVGPDFALDTVARLRERVKAEGIKSPEEMLAVLRELLVGALEVEDGDLASGARPTVVLVVGVNGSGKTTSIAKLAHSLKRAGLTSVLAAGDTFRAGAIDQLKIWGERLGQRVVAHQPGADPAAVVFDAMQAATAAEVDYLIVDTAGRLQTNRNLMAELEKVVRIVTREVEGAPHEVLLVLDGLTGQNGMSQARLFGEAVGVTGIILAKLDSSSKGGVVFSVTRELGVPIKFVGTGESIEDLAVFDAAEFVEALLRRDE